MASQCIFCISGESVVMHVMFFCVPEVTWWGRSQCEALWPNHIHGQVILVWLKESLQLFTRRKGSCSSRGREEWGQIHPLWLAEHISSGNNNADWSHWGLVFLPLEPNSNEAWKHDRIVILDFTGVNAKGTFQLIHIYTFHRHFMYPEGLLSKKTT